MSQKQLNRKEFFSLYPKSLKRNNQERHFKNERSARNKIELIKLANDLGCRVEDL